MLLVEKVTFTLVCLKSFVMNLVSLPTYVNLDHLCFWGSVLWSCFFFFGSIVNRWVSYLLLTRICSTISFSFSLSSEVSWYVSSLLRKYLIAAVSCSLGCHESLGIMMSVVVGFL